VEDELVLADDYGMTGVVPAAIADDDVHPLRQQVDVLPFSLVAPLGADDHEARHFLVLLPVIHERRVYQISTRLAPGMSFRI
jgi:hypothetical protein